MLDCLRSRWVIVAFIVMATAVLPHGVFAGETLDRPVVKASALYMIELQSGRVLLEKNATRRLPPASLTKIMTALVALEAAPLQQVVKIDGRAIVHRSSLHFQDGEEYLLRDLVTAMLVASANDACEAVAWHIGGGATEFVTRMNERAKTLGLDDTHFTNACGFDAPGHYSTAADLAKVTQRALQIPAISMMVRTVVRTIATVDGTRQVVLQSTNELLADPDVTGVKTGYTSKAGRCLIASMFKDGHQLLLVALNVIDRWEQAPKLLRYGQMMLRAETG
ncbi:MAG TPA: serine hydrolase [Nitrospira sp.]|nr:serine hydrolase [Nitrospira sp.]